MRHDAQGLIITTGSDAGAAAFDHVVAGYLKYRADLPQRVKALLDADPEFGLAHCIQGYLAMLAYKESAVPKAIASERLARGTRPAPPTASARMSMPSRVDRGGPESRHRDLGGHPAEHPRDVVAFRLAPFLQASGSAGPPTCSLRRAVLPALVGGDGLGASILACRCFAHEEAGNSLAPSPPAAGPSRSTRRPLGRPRGGPRAGDARAPRARASTG